MVSFRPVDESNREAVEALEVAPAQQQFVSNAADSIREAAAEPAGRALYWAIYADETPVGFVMISDDVEPGVPGYIPHYLWKLFIDERYQGRGFGTATLDLVVEYFRGRPGVEVLSTSAGQGNGSPIGFYERYGFEQTGDIVFDNEVLLQLSFASSCKSESSPYDPTMVPEALLKPTEHGLMPAGRGWFVLNAREARWFDTGGRGKVPGLQGEGDFPQLGLGLTVLEPGEPMSMYHWETDQEDFLVLAGEALLIVEGEERRLRQWDFVHCPPETQHVIVGAGGGPCIVFAVGALENHTFGSRVDGTLQGTDDWGAYTVDEAALRHGAGVEEETTDADVAYARFAELEPTRYREGWLPS